MATAAELAVSANNYTGNAGLGGSTFGFVKLDTDPIQDLAKYTMLYNKSEYDQRQKDAETAAAEIADMTSYDLTSGIPKDAKLLQEKYDRLTNYVRENPTAIDYRNKEQWAEYKKMRNDLENDLKGGKIRNAMWAMRQKEIQEQPNQSLRDIMQKELDAEIEATDIRTPIKHTQQYQDNTVKLPDAPELTFDVTKVGPNAVVERDYSIFNVPKARANGDVFALGLDKNIDPNTPQGQRDALASKNNFWLQGAEAFNSVLGSSKTTVENADGTKTITIDESKLSKLPRNLLSLVKETNQYLEETKADIQAGVLLDKFENPITFGAGAVDEADYAPINYQDGISPEELALVAQYAKWKGDTYKTKTTQTDNAIQLSGQEIQKRGQDLENQQAKARIGLGYANLNLDKEKWKATQTGGETVKNGAVLFAERLYGELKSLANKDGVITPDKIRQLNGEQLKYLGLEKIETNEAGTSAPKSVFSPLSVTDNDIIQLENGKIKVMKDATLQPNGIYVGGWDNTRSTNISNIATNRLNEQLRIAGAKELNSYLPLDKWEKEVSVNTSGGSTSSSGATTNSGSYSNVTILQDAKGNSVQAGVKDGKWYDIKTGKELK